MEVQEVFTPGSFPEYTYVERERGQLEGRLRHQLRREGAIMILSGPSKSGKSVLAEQVIGSQDLVSVYGGDIGSVDDLWDRVLDALGAPQGHESTSSITEQSQTSGNIGIRAHFFSVGGSASETESTNSETVETYDRRGLADIIETNEQEPFTLVLDDYHYLDSDIQSDIGEALKQASEQGLRICIAVIPHRSDDLTQANPDLHGRARTLTIEYWSPDDLVKIGNRGFESLNVDFDQSTLDIFAEESVGSPQLMQQLCYDACGALELIEEQESCTEINMDEEDVSQVLTWTGNSLNLNSEFAILNGDGISGGKERNVHEFVDGSEGDVYESILRGIAASPISVSMNRTELVEKIECQCDSDPPGIPSITQALERMDERTTDNFPKQILLEWDDDTNVIEVPDPNLIFYLRWSDALNFMPTDVF